MLAAPAVFRSMEIPLEDSRSDYIRAPKLFMRMLPSWDFAQRMLQSVELPQEQVRPPSFGTLPPWAGLESTTLRVFRSALTAVPRRPA